MALSYTRPELTKQQLAFQWLNDRFNQVLTWLNTLFVLNSSLATAATPSTVALRDSSGNLTANIFNGNLNGDSSGIDGWKASTSYNPGYVLIINSVGNGIKRCECVTATVGTSGTTEPIWQNGLVTDGTVTWLVNEINTMSPGNFVKLVVTNTSNTITLTADVIVLRDSTGTKGWPLYNVNASLTPAVNPSTLYYLWIVYTKNTNTYALKITTTNSVPSGYDFYQYISGRFTDNSGRLIIVNQKDKKCTYIVDGTILTSMRLMASGTLGSWSTTAPTWALINVLGFVSPTARKIGLVVTNYYEANGPSFIAIAPNGNYGGVGNTNGNHPVLYISPGTGIANIMKIDIDLEGTSFCAVSSGAGGGIYCCDWEEF